MSSVPRALWWKVEYRLALRRKRGSSHQTPQLKKGAYSIRVGTATADLAGNMIDRPFEIDVFERVDQNLNRTTRSGIQGRLGFRQRPSPLGIYDHVLGAAGTAERCPQREYVIVITKRRTKLRGIPGEARVRGNLEAK